MPNSGSAPGSRKCVRGRGTVGIGLVAASLAFSMGGCRAISGDPLPASLRTAQYCVERHPRDGRNLAREVEASLRQRGIEAFAVEAGQCDPAIPWRISYVDSWSWDLRTFLSRFMVEVHDAKTGESVALGEATETSVSALGSSHRQVIDRAIDALVAKDER